MVQKSVQKVDVYREIQEHENEYVGNPAMGSLSLLTFPPYIDAARTVMFTSHTRHREVLCNTEFPRVSTGYENMVGDNSSYNMKAKRKFQVVNIIRKFEKIQTPESLKVEPRLVFIYDEENQCYDVIHRNNVEDLTEKYGFEYDTSGLDQFGIGDTIEPGTTLVRPTSYDEAGNYGFGQNIRFMYQVDNDTIEDAIVVSKSLAQRVTTTEVEKVTTSINDNDFLLNLYGDNDNYKTFPNIGESVVDKRLCVKRRITNPQILFDFKQSNTKTILSSDIATYISGEIVDIDIWCNKPMEEVPNTIFNKQLIEYLQMSNVYYTKVRDYTGELIDSGIPCSSEIKNLHKRASQLTSGEYKIKDDSNSVFSNIIAVFTVKRKSGLSKGQKLTGEHNCLYPSNCGDILLNSNYQLGIAI